MNQITVDINTLTNAELVAEHSALATRLAAMLANRPKHWDADFNYTLDGVWWDVEIAAGVLAQRGIMV